MCLDLKDKAKLKIAKKDIVCYKHLIQLDGTYRTPYQNAVVSVNQLLKSKLVVNSDSKFYKFIDVGFHLFKRKGDAMNDAIIVESAYIARCIIPKGAEYYVGKFCGRKSYASNQIKYLSVKEITEKEITEKEKEIYEKRHI